jgi:hypothetical protein
LQLSEVLDEGHHLCLKALSMHILYGGHLQAHADVMLSPEQRVRLPIPGNKDRNVTQTAERYKLVFEENMG